NGEYKDNVFMVDYDTGRVGVNLGSGVTPAVPLNVAGTVRFQSTSSSSDHLEFTNYSGSSKLYRPSGSLELQGGNTGNGILKLDNSGGFTFDGNTVYHSGNFTVTESDVTAHEAALNIATSQLTGNIDLTSQVTGTLPVSNMAATALTTVQTAANQTAHLALTAQEGDVVVRSDENKTYMHNGGSAGTMADYTLLATPTDSVTSVNGNTGAVTVTVPTATSDLTNDSGFITSADGGNATTLDGIDSGSFLRSDQADTMTGELTISGSSPQMKFNDTSGEDDFWIHVNGNNFYILTDRDDNGSWDGTYPLQLTNGNSTIQSYGNTVWTSGNDGSGSGLDADTVDGIQASSFLRSDAADTFTETITGDTLHLGDSQITGSSAKLQVNGFMRTGSIYLHAGTSPTSDNYPLSTTTNGVLQWDGHKVWHAASDGSGSGLDADTVDGVQASSFLRSDTDDSVSSYTNQIQFPSNTSIDSSSSDQASLEIRQNTAGEDAFMQFHVAGDYATYFGLDGSTNDLAVGGWSKGANKYKIWHAGNDGGGSGLDADTVDGIQASSFLRSDATDVMTGQLNIENHIDMSYNNSTANRFLKLPRSGGITFYGDGSDHHAIMSRNASNSAADDILISSYGGVHIDLDSNNNDGSGADFTIGKHNSSTAYLTFSGETSDLTVSGNVTAYSDKRLKEEIKVIENAVEKVKEIRGVTYKDIETKINRTGVIAQEVEKVLPEAVTKHEETGMLSVAYGNMVGLLIESVKELTERVETLEKKLGE
ncbi:tail fiber domain-containing protein, partial [Alphaproteobacteria bacterium]|nr:tail fiber domain-containing protein [Alphaproteobacteria bacterium]